MAEITEDDLRELGRLLKNTEIRMVTKRAITAFSRRPEVVTKYMDYEMYLTACKELSVRNAAYMTVCSRDEGIFWTLEL